MVIRDSEGNVIGYIEAEEPSQPYVSWERKKELMALAEKLKREEVERAKELKRQKPARIAIGCLFGIVALIGIVLLGGENHHEVLAISIIGGAFILWSICYSLFFR